MRLALRIVTFTLLGLASASVAAAQSFHAHLDGAQEVPSNVSVATGTIALTYDPVSQLLSYTLEFSGLSGSETASHIHGPAAPGVNAGVIFPLAVGSPSTGSVGPLSAQQLSDLTAQLLYVNVHSIVFPGGEIRGQILRGALAIAPNTWGAIKELYRTS